MNTAFLLKTALFRGMTEQELLLCLRELNAQVKDFEKGSILMHAGSMTDRMGLVLSGGVTIESNDVWGNCTILSHVGPGSFFAETYAMLPDEVMLVDVRASQDSRILFLKIGSLFMRPPEPAGRPGSPEQAILFKLTRNLMMISAHKNLALSGRSFHTAPKSARGRILSYLNSVSLRKKSPEFDIPFNRQQLADYLNLERTNMSKELGRMQREGILTCRKNHFVLHG
ncbi:MAG: Crp/Fnr family transcriptional regulator [Sarcina sp.]|nr:Crp/Fnr family transcriptional regulator [Sarcina sp.]